MRYRLSADHRRSFAPGRRQGRKPSRNETYFPRRELTVEMMITVPTPIRLVAAALLDASTGKWRHQLARFGQRFEPIDCRQRL
jgi:hypothetical protein